MTTTTRKTTRPKLRVEECPWESGKLGRDEAHVRVADAAEEAALDEALGMQLISVRLQAGEPTTCRQTCCFRHRQQRSACRVRRRELPAP